MSIEDIVDEHGVVTEGPLKGSHTREGGVPGRRRREIVWHRPVDETVGERGDETHPAWGMVSVHRISSTPGATLFDSDIRHRELIRVTLKRASRRRDLHHDWLHSEDQLFEIDMSEAQWAAFVSSFNTDGVPCTLRALPDEQNIDGLKFKPRLKESMDEVRGATARVFGDVIEAFKELDELGPKAGVKARRAAMSKLKSALANAESNVEFAATSLDEHVENVVQKARADIEAMMTKKAEQLGIETSGAGATLALGTEAVWDSMREDD